MASKSSDCSREVFIEDTEEEAEQLAPQEVSSRVSAGEFILKKYKCSRGSRAWKQFCIVFDLTRGKEVFGIACCSICKVCILYKKIVNGQEKSLGTKNLLNHLKRCSRQARSKSSTEIDGSSGGNATMDGFMKK